MAEEATNIANPERNDLAQPPPPERKNLLQLIRDWPLSRKIATGAVLLISIALFSVLIFQARIADQQLLYANLSMTDASSVVTWLKSQKINYTIKNGGRDIWTPADQIYQTRLDLAANGLPGGGDVGFEVFDKQSFALTDYVQKVNHTRALQGELSRTITSLAPVETTRVHLALPEKRVFKKQQKKATASVIVTLAPGMSLDQKQVQGIIHLVAGSVTGLDADNVTVIDSSGVVLEPEKDSDEEALFSGNMLAFQQEVEHRLEMRAQDLLDRTMGKDHGMVRVTATLDFSKVEKTEEFFDGDEPVIRSEQVNQETAGGQTSGGVPGVQSNLQGNALGQTTAASPTGKNSRVTNYEISKTISKIINPVGTITKLSVSVLVADPVEINDEGKAVLKETRTDDELDSIKNMVSTALGLVPERGDIINVLSLPFVNSGPETAVEEQLTGNLLYEFIPFIKYALIAIGILLTYFLLIRPIIKTMKGEVKEHYKTVEQLEQEQKALREAPKAPDAPAMPIDETITALRREVMQNQAPTAYILKNWIQEG